MFLRAPAAGETADASIRSTRTWSSSSSAGRGAPSLSGISNGSEQQEGSAGGTNEEPLPLVVGVAVGKEVKQCKANLMWVLSNLDALIAGDKQTKRKATVVLLHVHRPAKTIPFMGANFPAEQLHESEVSAFRQAETQAMNLICAKVKVHAVCKVETAVAGDGDVAQGILRLVAQNGIRRLVVGAAADKRYSSKMTAPSVQQHAHPLCAIWFLCKGNLICTRPAAAESQAQHAPAAAATYTTRRGSLRRNDGEEPPPPPPPSVVHRIWVDNQQQEQDIQSIFAEAEKLKREQQVVAALEAQVVSSKRVIQDLQEKLSEAHCLLFSLEHEQEELRRQRDAALREAAALRDRLRHLEDKSRPAFIDLSYDDLLEATRNLDEALRLGQPGGYGAVYRAVVLRRGDKDKLEVAVKGQGGSRFRQQVEELSKLRHPNVVPLLGACSAPEASALVYEYLPGGSLEERLAGSSKEALLWPERTRIAAEVRAALVFLHRNNMVHGDLKPANVLLGLGLTTSKLADVGLCRLLEADATAVLMRCTVAYMDPEFLASGELRPSSDAYAFGVLLLRLLTGLPAMGLARQVQAALVEGRVTEILDASAGDWPYTLEQAEQLAHLAVRCCEMTSDNRPDLAGEMDQTLECFQLQ
ncbi:hypothetical protein PAHAL_4G000500 [Panicum hallii]|uniref:RING-type E3 ubiquitin transferase n=1 Tax=Panicum hallii TaxID=206008 RepID=A0A2T8JB97_9POAL|nr:hypothetical protein PAHAL_4G000500 [Panicum hallii]